MFAPTAAHPEQALHDFTHFTPGSTPPLHRSRSYLFARALPAAPRATPTMLQHRRCATQPVATRRAPTRPLLPLPCVKPSQGSQVVAACGRRRGAPPAMAAAAAPPVAAPAGSPSPAPSCFRTEDCLRAGVKHIVAVEPGGARLGLGFRGKWEWSQQGELGASACTEPVLPRDRLPHGMAASRRQGAPHACCTSCWPSRSACRPPWRCPGSGDPPNAGLLSR